MQDNQQYQDVLDWFLIQSKAVQRNSKIVSREDSGYATMLHIDKNMPKLFVPRMPRSAVDSENDTTARITVAPTLLGCFLAYQRGVNDFFTGSRPDKTNDQFRGGYDICELDFDFYIEPNEKLVHDAPSTGEKWLVSYDKKTLQYKPSKIGKIFVSQVTAIAQSGRVPKLKMVVYAWHESSRDMLLTENVPLSAGYYRLEFDMSHAYHVDVEQIENLNHVAITQGEWNSVKGYSAALLSIQSTLPKSLSW